MAKRLGGRNGFGAETSEKFSANRCTELIDCFTDFLPYILSVFSLKLVPDNCLQLLTTMVAYTDGIRMLRFWNFLHCVPTNFVCVFVRI